ncbi:MAG: hypothetical protein QOJ15_1771 [Bradyrhizobium sp.]|jgi:hypothetical protein|nr:hypothetical protein [Bradyrhizobium sp.]
MIRFAIRAAALYGAILTASAAPAAAQPVELASCLVESVAVLRLSELAKIIASCAQIVDDAATPREMRGRALGQRGLLYAKRWSIIEALPDAQQGIADITEGLRQHNPAKDRKHHFLNIRGQLYLATGQAKRASDDFKAVLAEAPDDDQARAGLKKTETLDNY